MLRVYKGLSPLCIERRTTGRRHHVTMTTERERKRRVVLFIRHPKDKGKQQTRSPVQALLSALVISLYIISQRSPALNRQQLRRAQHLQLRRRSRIEVAAQRGALGAPTCSRWSARTGVRPLSHATPRQRTTVAFSPTYPRLPGTKSLPGLNPARSTDGQNIFPYSAAGLVSS